MPNAPLRVPRVLISVAVVAVIGVVSYAVALAETHHDSPPALGAPVASATLHDGSKVPTDFTLDALEGGDKVAFANLFDGHPVVLNFFASWCPLCAAELSTIARFAHDEHGRVRVIGVDTSEHDQALARKLLAGAHATYPVVLDTADTAVADAYGIADGLPVTFFITSSGTVASDVLGQVTASELAREGALLTKK